MAEAVLRQHLLENLPLRADFGSDFCKDLALQVLSQFYGYKFVNVTINLGIIVLTLPIPMPFTAVVHFVSPICF